MPSLIKAMRMQEKAAQVGFDWPDVQSVWGKVKEELGEFEAEVTSGNASLREAEMGDLLFSLINYCRHAGMNPDTALERTNAKFRKRFMYMEAQVTASGRQLSDLKLEEMDQYWNEAKKL
jgi:XTP/dITP diphosphohydrolase